MAGVYYYSGIYKEVHRGKAIILAYHRVLPEQEMDGMYVQPGMYVSKDVFEMQMQFLKEHFTVVSFGELIDLWNKNTYDPRKRYCVITFDDGWLDNYTYAYPVLKRYEIPATIFLPTAFVGTNKWFWPDKIGFLLRHYLKANVEEGKKRLVPSLWDQYPWMKEFEKRPGEEKLDLVIDRLKRLPEDEVHHLIENTSRIFEVELPEKRVLLNWEEVKEMSENGISFGSHSAHHKVLTRIKVAEAREEVESSLGVLKGKNINLIPVFCYPNGEYNGEMQELVKQSGYQAAVTTRFGFEYESPQNLFGINRIGIHNDMTPTVQRLSWHIAGYDYRLSRLKPFDRRL